MAIAKSSKTIVLKVALYARVSTDDQQMLSMQLSTMRAYAKRRGWKVAIEAKEVGSGAKTRPKREELLRAGSLKDLYAVGVGFVSRTEALDRVKAGIAQARMEGRAHGRPPK